MRQIVVTSEAPAAIGPYSQAVRAGDFIFTAGQLGIVPATRQFAGPDIEAQARQALENIKAIVEAAGSCLQHVVKASVYLQDIQEWPKLNAVYAEYFSENPPARSAFQVAALPMGARVEIEVVAVACDCNDEDCGCDCH